LSPALGEAASIVMSSAACLAAQSIAKLPLDLSMRLRAVEKL